MKMKEKEEVEAIKDVFAKANCPQDVQAIQRAVMMPDGIEFDLASRKYPMGSAMLMENPFPKKKKKGKKKKGKK